MDKKDIIIIGLILTLTIILGYVWFIHIPSIEFAWAYDTTFQSEMKKITCSYKYTLLKCNNCQQMSTGVEQAQCFQELKVYTGKPLEVDRDLVDCRELAKMWTGEELSEACSVFYLYDPPPAGISRMCDDPEEYVDRMYNNV